MRIMMLLGRATGGIGAHVDSLVTALRDQGDEVIVVTANETAQRFGWRDAHRLWPINALPGVPVAPIKWHRIMKLAGRVDVVHAHGFQAAVVGAAAAFRAKGTAPLVVSLHNQLPDDVHPAYRRVIVAAMRYAKLVTGASRDLVDLAERLGAPRAELATVPAPRVPDLLATTRPTADWVGVQRDRLLKEAKIGTGTDVSGRPLLLTVSRIAPQKNLAGLIDAAKLSRSGAVWAVVGGGDPVLRAELDRRAQGVDVFFVGEDPNVERWLAVADAVVLSSSWEARALAIQEAMAAGVPVVVPSVGGLPDLVGDAGIVVPPDDPASLADAVDAVLADPSQADELAARGRTLAQSWPTVQDEAGAWASRYARARQG